MANRAGRNLSDGAGPIFHPPVVSGYVSRNKPAPAAFGDPLWIIIPSYSTEYPYKCAQWVAAQGKTLPAQGVPVTVVVDIEDNPTVVWFGGTYS